MSDLDELKAQCNEALALMASEHVIEVTQLKNALELAQEAMSDMNLQESYSVAWEAICDALRPKT